MNKNKAKMGFDEPPIRRKYGNVLVTAVLGNETFHFKSKLEYRWAQYLEFLKLAGEIKSWQYEADTFTFVGVYKLRCWTPDFRVFNNDREYRYFETKGVLLGIDIKKCKALFDQYPEVKLTFVFWTKPKISVQKRNRLERYCHRVIYGAKNVMKNVPIDMG